jgi:hypothetical protein
LQEYVYRCEIKNSNLIESHRIPIILREMTLMIVKDAIVSNGTMYVRSQDV